MKINIDEYDAVKMFKYIQENSPVYEQLKERLNLQEKMYAELNESNKLLVTDYENKKRLLADYNNFIRSNKDIESRWNEYKKSLYTVVMQEVDE